MAPAAEGLPALSDGLRLLSKWVVVGDMGTEKVAFLGMALLAARQLAQR